MSDDLLREAYRVLSLAKPMLIQDDIDDTDEMFADWWSAFAGPLMDRMEVHFGSATRGGRRMNLNDAVRDITFEVLYELTPEDAESVKVGTFKQIVASAVRACQRRVAVSDGTREDE